MADGGVAVVPARSKRLRKEFFEFPYRLYRGHPHWVPPLRKSEAELFDVARHPFYRHADAEFFVARRGARVTGRILACVDRYGVAPGAEVVGTFGFFECENDPESAQALFRAVRQWLAARGVTRLGGPFNPSYLYGYGILVDGFEDAPYIGTPYHLPYYGGLIEAAGLRKAKDHLALRLSVEMLSTPLAQRMRRAAAGIAGLSLRGFRLGRVTEEVDVIHDLVMRSWRNNWGFRPMPREEMAWFVGEMLRIADLRGVRFLELDGRAEALLLVLPDWNQILRKLDGRLFPWGWLRLWRGREKMTRARILALGATEALQGSGAVAAFLEALPPGREKVLGEIEASLVLEDNTRALKALALLGAVVTKTYRNYEGAI